MHRIHLNDDKILDRYSVNSIANYITGQVLFEIDRAERSNDFKLVFSLKFFDWVVKHWPNEYLGLPWVITVPSRLGKLLHRFGLSDPWERQVEIGESDPAIEEMRRDIVDNRHIWCYGLRLPFSVVAL